jgi:PhnB protein
LFVCQPVALFSVSWSDELARRAMIFGGGTSLYPCTYVAPREEPLMTSNEVPMPPVTPHLVVDGAAEAIEFYKAAFGAEEIQRMPAEDGKRLMHAAITINGGIVMLMDDFPEYADGQRSTPQALGGSPVTLHLQVADVDAAFKRAVDAGATVVMEVADQFWGDRYGQVKDPFGHSWSLASPIRRM